MSISLDEASKLSTDILLKGIIETIIKDSPILQELPFIQIVGNSLKYNRESVLPTVNFYDVADTWVESTPEFEAVTAVLRILGGDADVDNFLKATRSNVTDLETAVIEQKAKALRHEFEKSFIQGNSSVNAKQFDGIHKVAGGTAWTASTAYAVGDVVVPEAGEENGFRYVCTVAGTSHTANPVWPKVEGGTIAETTGVTWVCRYGGNLSAGTGAAGTVTPGALDLTKLDALIDLVRGGKPDLLLMSRLSRRRIQVLARTAGTNLEVGKGKLGETVQFYNGIRVAVSDWVLDNLGPSSNCTTIYAFQMGEGAVCGLTSPEMIQVERLGSLETKDAARTRIKWYCSLALFSTVNAAMLSWMSS